MRRSFFTASPFPFPSPLFLRAGSHFRASLQKIKILLFWHVRTQVQLRIQFVPGEKMCVWGNGCRGTLPLSYVALYLFPFPPLFHSREWGLSVCFASWHPLPLELSNNSRNGLAFPLLPRLRDFVIKSKRRTRKKESTNERPHYLYRVKHPWLQQHFSPALWSIYMEL